MRISQASDNGNVTFSPAAAASEAFNENRSWRPNPGSKPDENRTNHSHYNPQCNAIYSSTETETFINYSASDIGHSTLNVEFVVCNRQYRINAQNNINCTNSLPKVSILEETNENAAVRRGSVGEPNVFSDDTPLDDDRVFDHSDTDDMSEKGHPVPRGIVNPNYPGFQHLAHTLQDYSSNIENFYQSENDMTDDDVDIEITELAYEPEDNQSIKTTECKNNNNNNISKDDILSPNKEFGLKTNTLDSSIQNDIPDLIKNISQNNNNNGNETVQFDLNCTDTDIENNFSTKDIIGDFNKEVEEEIKHLLNYNINIQDDLEELRRDIKDTFAKPIENTINNISDVVNHVIKKLVEETKSDTNEDTEIKTQPSVAEENNEVNIENEKNARTEMNLSRPTFLFIDTSASHKIDDAILSDGKDEINISEYDADKLSQNVENTIKQLSTELRKIIPKLDEMRERDRIWAERSKENMAAKDGNSNEIGNSSSSYNLTSTVNTQNKKDVSKSCRYNERHVARSYMQKSPVYSESRTMRDRQKESSAKHCYHSAQSNTSVRKNDSSKDLDLGSFDVYNIETALPKLDIDAIENHLRAAKEAERRKRNDREEIRKRLAMGAESEEYYSLGHTDRPGKKPSLHSRLQSGAKLKPSSLTKNAKSRSTQSLSHVELKESDFYALQATLQTEARIALAQAKEMARIQMERERRARAVSPVTEMLRRGMAKASAPLAPDRRRVSRQLLTDMNVAQLQVVVNELHSQIEWLNESLVKLLLARDDLHMGQDSMLVDIEDLTRYLGVKEQTKKTKGTSKTGMKRLTSLVHK